MWSARNGGGFRGWRRYSYTHTPDGTPQYKRETNAEITQRGGGYSGTAQFQKAYYVDGEQVDYYGWVKAKLTRTPELSASDQLWWEPIRYTNRQTL